MIDKHFMILASDIMSARQSKAVGFTRSLHDMKSLCTARRSLPRVKDCLAGLYMRQRQGVMLLRTQARTPSPWCTDYDRQGPFAQAPLAKYTWTAFQGSVKSLIEPAAERSLAAAPSSETIVLLNKQVWRADLTVIECSAEAKLVHRGGFQLGTLLATTLEARCL